MRDRLTRVIAITALVVAVLGATPLGEAAYNAVVPKNSVGAQQLRKGAVTSVKIRGDAVTSGKVRNRSLEAIDFKLGELPAGPPGTDGTNGTNGVSGYERIRTSKIFNAPFPSSPENYEVKADCRTGKVATGGGGFVQYFNAGGFLRLGAMSYMRGTYSNVDNSVTAAADAPPAGVTRITVHAEAFCITATTN